MNNLFSIFDPVGPFNFQVNWVILLIPVLLTPKLFWASSSKPIVLWQMIISSLLKEFNAIFTPYNKGLTLMFVTVFLALALLNLLSLLPYTFTPTGHYTMTLPLALWAWGSFMLYSSLASPRAFLAHLVPLGTPAALMSFMVLVELISTFIRPITLSVRLAANLVAGHLLLSLLGGGTLSLMGMVGVWILPLAIIPILLLLTLELGVAIIQGYVFSLLSALYLKEVIN